MILQPNGQQGPLAPTLNTPGGVGGPSASGPGGTPKKARPAPAAPNTFSGMQQTGVARPSPAMVQQNSAAQMAAPPAPAPQQAAPQMAQFQRPDAVQQLGAPLMAQVMALLQDPTQGLNDAAQSNFDRNNRVLGREFTTMREGLNENMAARGLDASTIAASGLGDLGARQADAQSDLATRIQEKLINDRAGAMQAAISSAMGLRGQEFDMSRDEFTMNRDTDEMGFQRGVTNQRLGMEGQRLNLDTELGRGNLALGRDRLGMDGRRLDFDQFATNRDFDYRAGQDDIDNTFREDDFTFRRDTDSRDFNERGRQNDIRNSQVDRDFGFRRDTDGRDFDRTVRRDANADARDTRDFDRGVERDGVRDGQFDRGFNQTQENFDRGFDQGNKNFTTSTMMDLLRSLGINGLSPTMVNSLFKSLGIDLPSDATTPGGGGAVPNSPGQLDGNGGFVGGGGSVGTDRRLT